MVSRKCSSAEREFLAIACGQTLELKKKWQPPAGRYVPSFKAGVDDWLSPADIERYAHAPDPWPRVQHILQAA
jgi:hypothetical protein